MNISETESQQDPENEAVRRYWNAPPLREPRNGLGLAALITSLIGVLFGTVPLTGFIAVALAIAALAMGLANRGRLKRKTATNVKTTRVAIVSAIVALALGIWGISIVFSAVDELDRDLEEISDELDRELDELERELEDDEAAFDEYLACVEQVDVDDEDFFELIGPCEEILD